jgi:hypothetical protein
MMMRRLLSLVSALLFLISVLVAPQPAAAQEGDQETIQNRL